MEGTTMSRTNDAESREAMLPCSAPEQKPSTNLQHSPPPQAAEPEAAAHAAASRQAEIQQQADWLREGAAAGYLYVANAGTFHGTLEILGYDRYVTDLLHEAGNPKDPVERMLVEQLVLAHHKIGSLHAE